MYPYIWGWNKWPADQNRKGQRCKVLARSKTMNTALIEFEDGFKMISIRWGLRKVENMRPRKVKQNWMIGKKKISLYDLYCYWGQDSYFTNRFGKVRPSEFAVEHVEAYLKAKREKVGPFAPHKTVHSETIVF